MNVYAIFALVNVVTSIVLGLLVFLADKRSATNRLFAIFTASIAIWSYAYFNWQIQVDAGNSLLWIHILMAAATVITPVYYHFCAQFLSINKQQRLGIIAGYVFIVVSILFNRSPLYIVGVHSIAGFSFWPIAGPIFTLFFLVWLAYAILPVFLLWQGIKSAVSAADKAVIRYILVGTVIGYAGGCTNYFLWYGIHIPPFGNVSASIYLALVAYAIMRHGLFRMKVMTVELLVFLLWLAIFVRMLLATTVVDQLIGIAVLATALIFGVLLIRSVEKEISQRELIERQEKKLEAANLAQEGLLHLISDEINGCLAKSRAGFAAIVKGDFGTLNPELNSIANLAFSDMGKGVNTITDILDASNLKKGTVLFAKKQFDLSDAVDRVVNDLKPTADDKHLELAWQKPTAAISIEGDEEKLVHHVIRNLIDNSIKYTPQGKVEVSLERKEGVARFVVQDTGIGITDEDKRRLFTEGGRGKDSIRINVHSTGYGLYIAKQVVQAQGGKIWAESDGAGKGSRFIVELPAI